jgi:hypothetical protein
MGLIRRVKPIDVAEVRRLYEQTNLPVDHIAAMHGLCRNALYRRIHKWGWRMRRPTIALSDPPRGPDEVLSSDAEDTVDAVTFEVAATAARIHRAITCELDAVEKVIAQLTPEAGDEAERAARVLASLARTLQEVARLDTTPAHPKRDAQESDDRMPDADDFIRDLARRMDQFARASARALPDARDDGGGA